MCIYLYIQVRTVGPSDIVAAQIALFGFVAAHCNIVRSRALIVYIFFFFATASSSFDFACLFSYAFFLHCQHFAVTCDA